MGAKIAVISHGAPAARPDSIAPVIHVREAAARPAHQRGSQSGQSVDDIPAQAVNIGNGRCFTHPDAIVDTGAQVFDKLAMKFGMDHPFSGTCPDRYLSHVISFSQITGV
jgi:hypothetical protein